ncbi:thioredoxin family protein [Pseudomonas yamanorum]|uniref:thioredoxin family protein n=1 Tax=Pseudomonas yamanorum TaxID=515393 RepID=UPI00159FCF9E|nr:thioredoxin family protein [Pseudomonas yamanorum]NWD27208.1 thioredoxin family protein [Pseudomonas yamanorum]
MGIATAVIANAEEYQQVLKAHKTVFMLFVSRHCSACREAPVIFNRIASHYAGTVTSLVLDTAHTPRHPEVISTPTLLAFQDGKMVEKLHGIGSWRGREPIVEELFSRYSQPAINPPTSTAPSPTPESRRPSHR